MTQRSGSTIRKPSKQKAQSFVEFALFLPIFLIMISGLVEFGFLLNEYMNLLDGPREGARFATDYRDPLLSTAKFNQFSRQVKDKVVDTVQPVVIADPDYPPPDTRPLDWNDIVVSLYSSICSKVNPTCAVTLKGQWSWANDNGMTAHASGFDAARLQGIINTAGSGIKPSSGLVVVELFYQYDQKLALPWITVFVPDPIELSTYTIMPIPGIEE